MHLLRNKSLQAVELWNWRIWGNVGHVLSLNEYRLISLSVLFCVNYDLALYYNML